MDGFANIKGAWIRLQMIIAIWNHILHVTFFFLYGYFAIAFLVLRVWLTALLAAATLRTKWRHR